MGIKTRAQLPRPGTKTEACGGRGATLGTQALWQRQPPPPSTCLLPDLLVLGEADDHLHVLVGQLAHGHLVVLLGHVVGKDDGGKDWEAVGGVESPIVVVVVDAGQLLGEAERSGGPTWGGPHLASP